MTKHNLEKILIQRILSHGNAIPFSDFMEHALYESTLGYYTGNKDIIGKSGDFTTAPEISPLFSHMLAKQCLEIFSEINEKNILEFGAGLGTMAGDILLYLEKQNALPDAYYILELSAFLKEKQKNTLEKKAPHLLPRVQWLSALPSHFNGVILANEVLDAMPITLFELSSNRELYELFVTVENELFTFVKKPSDNPRLIENIKPIQALLQSHITEKPYRSEVNLHLTPWITSLANMLKQGAIILVDYGFPREEYYHPERNQGTLMAHYQHQAHADPLVNVGKQDITAHVDFTAVLEAGKAAALDFKGYSNQADFLMALGILEEAQREDIAEQYEISQGLKYLLLPSEMGELFKVMAFSKGISRGFSGFA